MQTNTDKNTENSREEGMRLRRFSLQLLFGFLSAGVFWMLVAWVFTGNLSAQIPCWFGGVGLAFFLICRLHRKGGLRILQFWARLTEWLEFGVTFLVLGLIYFLVVTPIGWLRRIFGRSPVELRPDKELETYFREPSATKEADRTSYLRPF